MIKLKDIVENMNQAKLAEQAELVEFHNKLSSELNEAATTQDQNANLSDEQILDMIA